MRPHCHHTRTVQSYLLGCAKVHLHLEHTTGIHTILVLVPAELPDVWTTGHIWATGQSLFAIKIDLHVCLQCFDTVGWAAGRESGP